MHEASDFDAVDNMRIFLGAFVDSLRGLFCYGKSDKRTHRVCSYGKLSFLMSYAFSMD